MSSTSSSEVQKKLGRPADAAKRQGILNAAAHCFFNDGFAATSIEQVAASASVSKVTVYNHFGDKRALFTAAVELECEKMRGYFTVEDVPSGSIRDRLAAIGEAMAAFLSRPEMTRFERRIAAETEHDPAIGQAFLKAGPYRMKGLLSAMLAHAVRLGELEIADTDLAAEQFAALTKGMGDLERRFGAPCDPDKDRRRIESAVDVFLAAYERPVS